MKKSIDNKSFIIALIGILFGFILLFSVAVVGGLVAESLNSPRAEISDKCHNAQNRVYNDRDDMMFDISETYIYRGNNK